MRNGWTTEIQECHTHILYTLEIFADYTIMEIHLTVNRNCIFVVMCVYLKYLYQLYIYIHHIRNK